MFFFFFSSRRRHTRCLSDWSSDVCSSDLATSCREAVANFRKGGKGGHIVNITARPALNPRQGANMTAYTASKAAVAAFTVALAEELKGENISVIALAPSTIEDRKSTRLNS